MTKTPCHPDCYYARGRRCECPCGGKNHGQGFRAQLAAVPESKPGMRAALRLALAKCTPPILAGPNAGHDEPNHYPTLFEEA